MSMNRPPCNGTCETEMGCDCIKRQPVVGDQQVRYQVREVVRPVVPAAFTPDDHRFDLRGQRWGLVLILLPWALLVMTWALIAAYKK